MDIRPEGYVRTIEIFRFPFKSGKVGPYFDYLLAFSHNTLQVSSFLFLYRDARLITMPTMFVVLREDPIIECSPFLIVSLVAFGSTFLHGLEGVIALLKLLQLCLVTPFGVADDLDESQEGMV